jgi:hypothetical protein
MDWGNTLCFFAVFFLMAWLLGALGVSFLGGWADLARVYRSPSPFEGQRWKFQSAYLRFWANYSNCLTVGVNPQGLYLAVWFPFRIGHPPLLIPWQDLSVRERKVFLWKGSELRFRQAPSVQLRLGKPLSQRVAASAGPLWPGNHAPTGAPF